MRKNEARRQSLDDAIKSETICPEVRQAAIRALQKGNADKRKREVPFEPGELLVASSNVLICRRCSLLALSALKGIFEHLRRGLAVSV
jgi:hypothetical protein